MGIFWSWLTIQVPLGTNKRTRRSIRDRAGINKSSYLQRSQQIALEEYSKFLGESCEQEKACCSSRPGYPVHCSLTFSVSSRYLPELSSEKLILKSHLRSPMNEAISEG